MTPADHSLAGNAGQATNSCIDYILKQSEPPMGLFKSDFYRAFAIGFAVGAVALFTSLEEGQRSELAARVVPHAVAASIQ